MRRGFFLFGGGESEEKRKERREMGGASAVRKHLVKLHAETRRRHDREQTEKRGKRWWMADVRWVSRERPWPCALLSETFVQRVPIIAPGCVSICTCYTRRGNRDDSVRFSENRQIGVPSCSLGCVTVAISDIFNNEQRGAFVTLPLSIR